MPTYRASWPGLSWEGGIDSKAMPVVCVGRGMQWGVGWGEVQVEGACREHVVYTEPNWQRDGLNTNVRCCAGWRDRMRLWEKKLNKATRMEMEKEPEMKEFKKVNER